MKTYTLPQCNPHCRENAWLHNMCETKLTVLYTYPSEGQTVPGREYPSVGAGACRGEVGPGAGRTLEVQEEAAPFQEVQMEASASVAFLRERENCHAEGTTISTGEH